MIVLDDGSYYVELNVNSDPHDAPGFLQRRCAVGLHTPGGYECLGSFNPTPGGAWRADVNAPYDNTTDSDARDLGRFADRVDAILALWAARHDAFSVHNL